MCLLFKVVSCGCGCSRHFFFSCVMFLIRYLPLTIFILATFSSSPVASTSAQQTPKTLLQKRPSLKHLKSQVHKNILLPVSSLFRLSLNSKKSSGSSNSGKVPADLKQQILILKPGDGDRPTRVSFVMTPQKHKTYHRKVYDRKGVSGLRGFRRMEALAELNQYKAQEMIVAPESQTNTQFHQIK